MERAARSSSGLTWLAAAFGAAACALAGEIGADSRWLAAVGAAIVRLGRIPHAIPYATAPSNGWHDAPALGQLCFHALEVALGDRGLLLAQVAAVGVALAALAVDLRRAGARDGAGAAVVLAVVAAVPATFFVVRAQLFSLALFPVLAAILRDDARRPSRRIWLAPPLLALWANLHGGVLVGAALDGRAPRLRRRGARRDARRAALGRLLPRRPRRRDGSDALRPVGAALAPFGPRSLDDRDRAAAARLRPAVAPAGVGARRARRARGDVGRGAARRRLAAAARSGARRARLRLGRCGRALAPHRRPLRIRPRRDARARRRSPGCSLGRRAAAAARSGSRRTRHADPRGPRRRRAARRRRHAHLDRQP